MDLTIKGEDSYQEANIKTELKTNKHDNEGEGSCSSRRWLPFILVVIVTIYLLNIKLSGLSEILKGDVYAWLRKHQLFIMSKFKVIQ